MKLYLFWRAILGPRLFRKYATSTQQGQMYTPRFLEALPDQGIKSVRLAYGIIKWTSPFLLPYFYRSGAFSYSGVWSLINFSTCLCIFLCICVVVRAVGRTVNPEYVEFLSTLLEARAEHSLANRRRLALYDFEFRHWPVDFDTTRAGTRAKPKARPYTNDRHGLWNLPLSVLSYVAIHTFGRRMVYPGSTSVIQTLIGRMLIEGRTKLIEKHKATRAKMLTEDGNDIDTIFIDRRNNAAYSNGNTLVICCEGNSGFYEQGCTVTPLEAGYSVLGWNHPGFGGSTGVPFPEQEQCAIDAVMQFALQRLGFSPSEVVLFAWSIGGYPATWAAKHYPEVKAVILDATFDDINELSVARMPKSWKNLVEVTIKRYMDLNISEQLCAYPGPALLIRRTRDEMITTEGASNITSNRGNNLLVKFLRHRFPNIYDEERTRLLWDYLGADGEEQGRIWSRVNVDEDLCASTVTSYAEENGKFPWLLGSELDDGTLRQLTLYLASKHMLDYSSTHCTPLPTSFFQSPWTATN